RQLVVARGPGGPPSDYPHRPRERLIMTDHPPGPPSRRTVLAAGVPAVVGLLGLSALTNPRPARLGDPVGDEQLLTALAPHLTQHRRVAVALLDGGGAPRFAGFGADA